MSGFVHLHNHTHNSILDAIATIDELISKAKENKQPAIALTDHGVMFGAIEFYKKAKSAGIKPLIGMEAYVASGSRVDKSQDRKGKKNYYHLLLLAKNITGYHNLMKLTSYGHLEGFYYKPRVDRELLEKYSDGLIACSGCLGGVVSYHVVKNDIAAAREAIEYYKSLYNDDFYLEIQRHNYPEDDLVMKHIPELAKEYNIKLVATNDIHYTEKYHAVAHNAFLLIKDSTSTNNENLDITNLRYKTPEFYFKSSEQMKELFKDYPEAISNTLEIADKCDLEIELGKYYMPEFPLPESTKAINLDEFLEEVSNEGLYKRFGTDISQEIAERLNYELGIIKNMGFAGYFLIVWDFIKAAREIGVRVGPGRGSAAGSLVAYCLRITDINPLEYDLLFERFLNPERISMPDIDIDFADDKRNLVIDYVKRKYGENAVSQIITFGQLKSKAAITDVGRILNIKLNEVKSITKKIPVNQGKVLALKEAFNLPDLAWLKNSSDLHYKQLIELSQILEDKYRNISMHAAGIVIAPGDITNYIPIYQPPKSKHETTDVVSQYNMKTLEEAGLIKMDFLGLRTLSIIENTLSMIESNHGMKVDIDNIDFHDKETFDLFGNGSTLGIFQFESSGMQEYLKKLKPHDLEELTAMNALYRPGPMDNIPEFIDRKYGKKPITYLHPSMEAILKSTYGIIVYQEQVMRLTQVVAGFTLGGADKMRKAMGKKDIKIMTELEIPFVEGAKKRGYNENTAKQIYELIVKFASYGFNKSHSVAYSYLAYQTAWLKAHYPAEFLAANMSAELNDQKKISALREESKKLGINLMPPDINLSFAHFTVKGNSIYFGLAAIRNVGEAAVNSIVEARNIKPFISLFDFLSRMNLNHINSRALEALIYSGAFDSIYNGQRQALLDSIEIGLEYAKAVNTVQSMDSLFGAGSDSYPKEPALMKTPEFDEKTRLEKEKEYLNFYISGHPYFKHKVIMESLSDYPFDYNVEDIREEKIKVCGIIISMDERVDKNGESYFVLNLEDLNGKCDVWIFSKIVKSFKKYIEELKTGSIAFIYGRLDDASNNLKIVADEVLTLEKALLKYVKGFEIDIDLDIYKEYSYQKVETILSPFFEGRAKKHFLTINVSSAEQEFFSSYVFHSSKINLEYDTITKLCNTFGIDNVRIITDKVNINELTK